MSIIDDLRKAIDRYETDNCKTEIVDFSITEGGETILNVGDTFQFKVKVTNQGNLDMKSVRVAVFGMSHADVALGTGVFALNVTYGAFSLDAHQTYTTDFFRGKAKAATGGAATDIVFARIESWDASFDHLLKDHTGAGEVEGRLNKQISPT